MTAFEPALGPQGNGPYRLLRGGSARVVARVLAALEDPEAAQRARLDALLAAGRETVFGREHGLGAVRTLEEFRSAVPIRDHEGHRAWLERVAAGESGVLTTEPTIQLLETSGTTGKPKHLPVTPGWATTVSEAQSCWILGLIRDYEALAKGSALTVVSPAEHARSPGGIPIGANTGRMHLAQPWWLRLRYPIPYEVFTLKPSDLKLYCLLRYALQSTITSITTANPSTVLLLCRKLLAWQEELAADLQDGTLTRGPAASLDPAVRRRLWWTLRRGRPPVDWRPAKIWPLVVVNCWKGGPAAYFVDRLPAALGADLPVREVGITASEGFFGVPLGDWDGGVLWTTGHLIELLMEDGQALGAWQWEPGMRGRLVITTEAGLYRYDLDDVVEVIGMCRKTPVIRFVGTGRRTLNAVGERLTEAQAAEALRAAARKTGLEPVGFTLGVLLGEVPRYRVAVEAPVGAPADPRFEAALDEALAAQNVEFQGRRETGRLDAPQVAWVPPGTYQRWRAARVAAGAPDGQIKDPVLALDDREWRAVVSPEEPG